MGPVAGSFLSLVLLGAANDRHAPNAADCKRALALAEEAVKQGEEFQFCAFQPMRLAIQSQALSANGRREEALDLALVALDTARLQAEPVSEIEALLALSRARHSLGMDWQGAIRDGSSIAEALQMTPALTRCRRLENRCKEPFLSQ
jgi:hypothetical protein